MVTITLTGDWIIFLGNRGLNLPMNVWYASRVFSLTTLVMSWSFENLFYWK